MTIKEFASKLTRAVSGGVQVDEDKWDNDYLFSKIIDGTAFVLRNDFLKYQRWSPMAIKRYFPEFVEQSQDNLCITKFKLPTGFLQADALRDGLVYVGSQTKNITFRRIVSRTEAADLTLNKRMRPGDHYIGVLIEDLDCEIYSKNSIEKFFLAGVWNDVTKLPTFNINVDEYPLTSDQVQSVIDYLIKTEFRIEAATPPDDISSSSTPKFNIGARGR